MLDGKREPPPSLQRLQSAVNARLSAAGVVAVTSLRPRTATSPWTLVVEYEDDWFDQAYASHGNDKVFVLPSDQEEVSVELATEWVAVDAGLLAEEAWWALFKEESARARRTRWAARRAHLRGWLRGERGPGAAGMRLSAIRLRNLLRRRPSTYYGDCPGCGHDWREHPQGLFEPAAVECGECIYEVEHHQRPEGAGPPCRGTAPGPRR